MMTKEDIKSVLDFLYKGAMDALQKDGYVAPFAFIATEQKYNTPKIALGAVPLDFETDRTKQKSIEYVRRIAREKFAVGVFVVTEGWIASCKGEFDGIRPSKRADKEEAVIISGNTPITTGFISQKFVKEGKEIILGEKNEYFGSDCGVVVNNNLISGIWETTC